MRILTLASLTIALISPALGQSTDPATPAPGNPGGMPPGTRQSAPGVPAPRQTNQPDRAFIHAATLGGLADVEFGKLAGQHAASRMVKEFAERMVRDHSAANDRLSALAQANGIAAPDKLDEEHKAMRATLEQSGNAQFDRVYIQGQIIEHQKTAQLLEYEIGSGENAELKDFASDLLPTVLAHLRMAQAIASEIAHQAQTEVPPKESPRGR
jgi:putative membrane protein